MAKRKLSLQQRRRIAEQRQERKLKQQTLPEDNELGPLLEGVVIANYGTQVLIEGHNAEAEKSSNSQTPTVQQRCYLRANLDPVTGDRVMWRQGRELGVLESIHQRSSELQRPDNYGKLRSVAANVSQLLIVIAPEPTAYSTLIDRYLVAANLHNLKAVLVLNKSELNSDDGVCRKLLDTYAALGVETLTLSAHTTAGLEHLSDVLKDHTSIFVGQSGVGKSSLIKALLPDNEIRIGELSEAAAKGRHTTTHSQLYHFSNGGQLIDSPGIREFGLWHASAEQVLQGFPEIAEKAQLCRFRDCKHNSEPGCAIHAALESGEISSDRYNNFQLIITQLDEVTIQTQSGIKKR